MAPNSRPKSAPRITARSVNSLILSSVEINGRNSPGGAVELHGRSLKESLPGTNQIGCVRDYAAREASGEVNLGWIWGFGNRNGGASVAGQSPIRDLSGI